MPRRLNAVVTVAALAVPSLSAVFMGGAAYAADKAGAKCSKTGATSKAADGTALVCTVTGKNKSWKAATATTQAQTTPVTAVADKDLKGDIAIDGSSTLFPMSEAAAELFQKDVAKRVRVTVGESGTGGGFKKFCSGETDISDASRPITADEAKACASKGVKYQEFVVANDGIALVVNPSNNFAACLTTAQLKKIWDSGSKVSNWRDVDELFPNLPVKLFGAGTASGTFDFFSEAINGKAKQHRSDYNATEDDNVTVTGVASSPGGLGYFGLSYALENANKVKIVAVDSGNGKCVAPSNETVLDGTYAPLSRPLFLYVKASSLTQPHVERFVEYYLESTDALAKRTLFVPLSAKQKATAKTQLAALKEVAKGGN